MKLLLILMSLLSLPAWAQLSHESELSLLNAGGNSELQAYNAITKNKYVADKRAYIFGGHYTYGEANSSLSARNWDVNAKYEQELTERWAANLAETIEGNRFQDVKVRYNSDVGAKYSAIKNDAQNWFFELAYRYTVEDRYSSDNIYQHKARTYTEWNKKHSETIQWKLWLEYLPNFSNGTDWMMTGEASVTAIMTSMFSLKVAYKGLYDHLPADPALKHYDYITTTSLVAKF